MAVWCSESSEPLGQVEKDWHQLLVLRHALVEPSPGDDSETPAGPLRHKRRRRRGWSPSDLISVLHHCNIDRLAVCRFPPLPNAGVFTMRLLANLKADYTD